MRNFADETTGRSSFQRMIPINLKVRFEITSVKYLIMTKQFKEHFF